jgi:hypothetical protein
MNRSRTFLSQTTLLLFAMGAVSWVTGCDVESTGLDTGGVGDDQDKTVGCPSGVTVVLSDYLSTQIALSDLSGSTLSESFISTGSAQTDGLSFVLSGDVALPSEAPTSGDVVLLDRFGTNVITWVDPADAVVRSQLPVGTGFESNPQDYLEIDEHTAWVTRWGQNTSAGAEDFDNGGDILIIDLDGPEIAGNIPFKEFGDLPPRPSEMTRVGDEVLVTLDRISLDFTETGEAMVLGLDANTGELLFEEEIEGRKACGKPIVSPDGSQLALACSGALGPAGDIEDIAQSAILIFDAKARPFQIISTFEALELFGIAVQSDVAFTDESTLLVKTQTPWGGEGNNELFVLNLESGDTKRLLEASADEDGNGKGIVYGGLFCAPGCGGTCLMPDSDEGVLQVIEAGKDGAITVGKSVRVEDSVGLPPIGIVGR